MEIKKTQKNPEKYFCENCDYNTSHKNDYIKHLLTPKHAKMGFGNEMEIIGNKKPKKTQDNFVVTNVAKFIVLILVYGNITKFVLLMKIMKIMKMN